MTAEIWEDQAAWPSFSEVAAMLGLNKATLSKQARGGRITFSVLGFGRGRHVVSPREVLRLGRAYRRVPMSVVQERLAAHLASRTAVDAGALLDELRDIASAEDCKDNTGDRKDKEGARGEEPMSASQWLLNVDRLVAQPESLTGTLRFVSADEVQGMARLGGRLDGAVLSLIESDVPGATPAPR